MSRTALRRQRDDNAIAKQAKIARRHGIGDIIPKGQEHRYAKHHAMDCGRPGCTLCSNPRRTWGEPTSQERKLFQDLDDVRDRHSNGLPPVEEE